MKSQKMAVHPTGQLNFPTPIYPDQSILPPDHLGKVHYLQYCSEPDSTLGHFTEATESTNHQADHSDLGPVTPVSPASASGHPVVAGVPVHGLTLEHRPTCSKVEHGYERKPKR